MGNYVCFWTFPFFPLFFQVSLVIPANMSWLSKHLIGKEWDKHHHFEIMLYY